MASLRRPASTLVAFGVFLVLALVAAGCGGKSEADKARAQVCDSASSIHDEVEKLQSLTLDTANLATIRDSLAAIRSDIQTIGDQLPALADDARSQVEAANQQFEQSMQGVLDAVKDSASVSEARAQFTTALGQLADGYSAAFDQLDC